MKKTTVNDRVLGVAVSGRAVHAVLLQTGPDGPQLLRRFSRQRTARFAAAQPGVAAPVPDLPGEGGDDFTLKFGDGAGGSELFLSSEFGGLAAGGLTGDAVGGDAAGPDPSFQIELEDILAECRDAGFADPLVAFCLSSTELTQTELRVPPRAPKAGKAEPKAGKAEPAAPTEEDLLKLLNEQYQGEVDAERVAFLPLTLADDGAPRYLALVPPAADPVVATLQQMRQQRAEMPAVRLVDSEASVYLGLLRAVLGAPAAPEGLGEMAPPAPPRSTLFVRAGYEDTLVLFMQGDTLQHCESLRSLTAYEAPETICSRVLLLQDEYGIGEVQQVLLLSEEQEGVLVESFEMFFPDARVEPLRRRLSRLNAAMASQMIIGAVVPAAGVALRLAGVPGLEGHFPEVNLLPKKLIARRRLKLPIGGFTVVALALVLLTGGYFAYRYMTVQRAIDQRNEELRKFPPALSDADAKQLQARIDSLQNVVAQYMHALDVVDTLLMGSDQWSRALETTSREVAAVRGLWIENWEPNNGRLVLVGNATGRDRVVQFAERTGAVIEALSYSQVREWPVYNFRMLLPLEAELPEAARYLRAQAAAADSARAARQAAQQAAQQAARQGAQQGARPAPPTQPARTTSTQQGH